MSTKTLETVSVINIKAAKNTSDEVYIGRAGKGYDGYFGNPIRLREPCRICGKTHFKPGETLECYAEYLTLRLDTDQEFRHRVKLLIGRTLVCFCKPKPCHGDILARYSLKLNSETTLTI